MKKTIVVGSMLFLISIRPGFADVTYEQETKMGGVMKVLTFGKGFKTLTRVSGDRMRTDSGNEAQIIDLAAGKIYDLDTKKKTYTVTTFEEMKQRIESAMAAAKGKSASDEEEGGASYSTKVDFKVSETGNSQEIKGYACSQYLMESNLSMTDKESGEQAQLETLMELWLTKDVAGVEEVNAFHRKMAAKLGTTEVGKQMFSGDDQSAQLSVSMREMAGEMKKLDGFAMRTVVYLGSAEAARQEALGNADPEKKEKGGGGLGGFMKKMTPLGGSEEKEESPNQGQQGGVVMKMTTETNKYETKSIDSSLFSVPEDFTLVEREQK